MAIITVDPQADGTYLVDVRTDKARTKHFVSVPSGLNASLGCEDVPEDELVLASFEFLLEREPPTSILSRFSLDVIGTYFPEYHTQIGQLVASRVRGNEPER
jgi:hypothetical protein